jgi:hypothetical protein
MSSISEILKAEFEQLRAEIATAYEAGGMAASGNWGEKLEIQAADGSASIVAPEYINGRKSGTPPPSEAIEEWIMRKGMAARIQGEITIGSLAYLIARKIGHEGWQPEQENVVESIATPARIQQILDKVGESCLNEFTNEIINHLKKSA